MKKAHRNFKVASILVSLFLLVSQYASGNNEDTATGIFSPRFKTLKVEKQDEFMSPPVLILGTGNRLIVTFDEIGDDLSQLSARLIHCDADWKPSRLVESEYLNGFNSFDIEDYAYSTNTFVHYVNYLLEIPSENIQPLVSGNYLLQIFDRDVPDETLLQARFRVVEPLTSVMGKVSTRTDKGFNDRFQQLDIMVDAENIGSFNPYQDLKVEIVPNNNSRDARIINNPLRANGKTVEYAHSPELIFPASNEYRRMESTSTQFPGMRIDSVRFMGSNYHVWVNTDYPRAERNYEYDRTQHGRFIVREYNATDSNIGADYITVHFYLDTPELLGKEVYVDGEMTYNRLDSSNKMQYNGAAGGYELSLPLKQGAYNYQYLVANRGENKASSSEIEGDKYETENEYNIYVYLRKPGDRYDRLVGYATLLSNN